MMKRSILVVRNSSLCPSLLILHSTLLLHPDCPRPAPPTAQKIKESLIARAKLKKSYSKVLKQEGMQSERLGTANRLPDAERDAGSRDKMSEKKRGKQRAAEVVEGDGDGSGSDEDDFGAQASEDEDDSMDGSDGDDVTDGRERQGRTDRGHDRSSKTAASSRAASRDGPAPPLSSSRPSWKDRTVAAAATAASETPNRQSQAGDRALPSLREMKREAYLGPKPKARKQEGEQTAKETTGKNFASTRGDKRLGGGGGSSFPPSGGVGRSRGARFPHSGGGGPRGGGKKRDNRPRMGARIGVMLEEIKRSKGIA